MFKKFSSFLQTMLLPSRDFQRRLARDIEHQQQILEHEILRIADIQDPVARQRALSPLSLSLDRATRDGLRLYRQWEQETHNVSVCMRWGSAAAAAAVSFVLAPPLASAFGKAVFFGGVAPMVPARGPYGNFAKNLLGGHYARALENNLRYIVEAHEAVKVIENFTSEQLRSEESGKVVALRKPPNHRHVPRMAAE